MLNLWPHFRSWQFNGCPRAIPWKGGRIMRNYELAFIIHPELDENAFNEVVQKIQGWITQAGGAVTKVDVWGKRPLAYLIRKQREGQYVWFKAQMENSFCAELERNLRITEPVMRFLIIREDE